MIKMIKINSNEWVLEILQGDEKLYTFPCSFQFAFSENARLKRFFAKII